MTLSLSLFNTIPFPTSHQTPERESVTSSVLLVPNRGSKDVPRWASSLACPRTAVLSTHLGLSPWTSKYWRAVSKSPGTCLLEAKVAAGWHGDPVTQLCGELGKWEQIRAFCLLLFLWGSPCQQTLVYSRGPLKGLSKGSLAFPPPPPRQNYP